MEKIWLKSYPPGMPDDIDAMQYRSLVHLMEDAFKEFAERNAFVCMGRFMTFAELDQLSAKVGAWLQSKGLKKGARVAIMMPNILQYPVAMAGILRAGLVVVNVNPLYTARELEHQLNDSGAEALFVLENFAHTVEKVLAKTKVKHVIIATMGDLMKRVRGVMVNFMARRVKKQVPAYSMPNAVPFKRVLLEAVRLNLKSAKLGHENIAFLQYTGGTTGVSKGAVLLHRNVIANILQREVWVQPVLVREPALAQLVIVCALPLYHIFALASCALMGIRRGALNILIPNPRDLNGFIKELSKFEVHMFPAVNTMYNGLLNHSEFSKLNFSNLRVCNSGGMAVQQAVADKWVALTGCPIVEGYGLSETSPGATSNRVDINEFSGTVGLPLPGTEVAILDDQGKELDVGQAGEIAIRGPQVMAGYWKRDDETAKVMTVEGFFKTGDIGIMDANGHIRIVDRKKDMILVSGFNVYPTEIEGVLASHPGVLECACIGVPDKNSGEAVKLFVVKKTPDLTKEALTTYCKEQFTAYKRPKYIEFCDELPKSTVGKILRRELRERAV
jgi:long-chain acyl-CoA synthetase